jgi:hypothetical protein
MSVLALGSWLLIRIINIRINALIVKQRIQLI